MKYSITDQTIPQYKRKEINDKIIYLINNNLCERYGITQADIFNSYTGDGGLHGLEYSQYNSFHDYTEAKKEIENGQFFTPHNLSKFFVDCLKPSKHDLITDLTCGMGNFFNYLPNESNVYGNELDMKAYKIVKLLYPEANLKNDDIRFYNPEVKFDLVLGNPPFNLKWEYNSEVYLSQLFYCMKANELLKPSGIMALIVPASFLNDSFTDGNLIKQMNNMFNFICQFKLPTDSFKNVGVNNFQTKVMIFQKKSEHVTEKPYNSEYITMPSLDDNGANYIYNIFVKPLQEQKEKVKNKVILEEIRNNRTSSDFEYKVKKLLFDIKCNPKINHKYGKAEAYLNKFLTQEKPSEMKWEEWEKKKLTENKVLSYMQRIIKGQHDKEQDIIKLVKTRYGLKYKAYSNKTKRQLNKMTTPIKYSFNDMILENYNPFGETIYNKLIDKKKAAYENQNYPITEMPHNSTVKKWLDNFTLYDNSTHETIKLNDMQKHDLHNHFQKRYSILNWEQGSGKTLAGIAWANYLFMNTNMRNVFVVAPALAVNLTWDVKLKDYHQEYIKIKSLKDIDNIKQGQIVILSLNMLIKYQKQLKKYVKMQSQKVALIVDESDELTNHLSKRTKATLNVFRKAHYKLLTTGTTTRNNINEIYSQLELLYNNSINMLSEAEYIYKLDKKDNELKEVYNNRYMCPFPAYGGQLLFKRSFSPSKTTVFGVNKENQDIYNSDLLLKLIKKTITTRKFEEITGEKKYNITAHKAYQNHAEKEVYKQIVEEFYKMSHYFRSTGNYKKDAMLKLIRQIQMLIKSTSIPHKFKEYNSNQLPNKFNKITGLLEKFNNEKVAIGTVFKEAAKSYYHHITEMFPNRSVFLILGDVTFNKRKQIIDEFEATKDGILISTQQSLKSSVNIPTCNKVIIESLQWNIPKISQYYFRFIRFNSIDKKEVHIVTYEDTIEQNLLALLMTKERINEFIKTLEYKDQSDVFDDYGIDLDILNHIIEKEKDEEGRTRLTWGAQRVI